MNLPEIGFLREKAILGCKATNTPPIIPVSRSSWWSGVKSGKYPQPIKLSEGITVWRTEDIKQLIESIKEKLLTLPPQTKVYPGHGLTTTIALEKADNPFLG